MSEGEKATAEVVVEEENNEETTIVTKLLKDCPMDSIVLYSDRCEITRAVEHEFDAPGLYDICIEGMSASMDKDTLRVSGGVGAATVLEVSMKTRNDPNADAKNLPEDIKAKKEEIEKIQAKISDIEIKLGAIETSIKWLDAWSNDVALTPPSHAKGSNEGGVPFLSEKYIDSVRNFTQFYAEEQEKLAVQEAGLQEELTKAKQELSRAQEALGFSMHILGSTHLVRIAVVSLQVSKAGKAAFHLVYRCRGCRWSSKYDLRVDEEKKVQITYFGVVSNMTGETWENTRLTLSTAEPSAGGEPPELATAKVSFVAPPPPMMMKAKRRGKFAARGVSSAACESMMCDEEVMCDECECVEEEAAPMTVVVAEAKHGMTSCSFDIPRRTTIESDGEEHKVTIAVVPDVEANIEYLLLPRLHDSVYMKAVCKNPCDFCFLAGPSNVFVEGSFVATCPMEYTSAGQEFSFFLGPDKDLRVTYRVPTAVADKTGIVFKNNLDNFVGEIRVKNNKDKEVKLTIQDQLPKSSSSEVTVTLVQPDIQQTPGVTIEERNLITWNKTISAGQTEVYPIRFTVEYPKDKKVTYNW